jgi:hypothetical protein
MRRLFERWLARRAAASKPPASRAGWSVSDWARVRAPVRWRDESLSERARRWLARLPDDCRPDELAARFPRILNQLAACWRDVGLTEHLLADLLADRRGRRQGFPPAVVAELEMLYEIHDARCQARSSAADEWSPSTRH